MRTARPRILHLISARGGGMSRFARDLLAPGDALLHAGEGVWVSEQAINATPARFVPYRLPSSPSEAADWLDALLDALGCAALHLHHLSAATLPLLEAWTPRGRPWLASLHDVGFRSADAFEGGAAMPSIDQDWVARCTCVLARACAISVPSAFLAEALAQTCPGLRAEVLAPGVPFAGAAARAGLRPLRSIAILGALGAHKGKERMLRWLAHPQAGAYRWTLIGYTEDQLHPGWIGDGRLWVHGPFQPQETAHWLAHYGIDLVLFPNRLAESFSYALSDAWSAGVPALVPDCGALGERVRAYAGGALLDDPDDAQALMCQLRGLADGSLLAHWRAQIETEGRWMVPDIKDMRASMATLYRRLPAATKPDGEALEGLQPWLRSQLDDVTFRQENIRLARDYAQVRAWAEKLEADVARLDADAQAQARARAELEQQLAGRDRSIESLRERSAGLEADAAALRERNVRVEADAAALVEAQALASTQAAELSARATVLSAQLEATVRQLDGRQLRIAELDGELSTMHQRISALESEIGPLRIKGARHDRVLGWIPAPLRAWLRALRQRLRPAAEALQ